MSYYSNLKMDREDEEGNIYDTDTINSLDVGEETENPDPKRYQLPYHTGTEIHFTKSHTFE